MKNTNVKMKGYNLLGALQVFMGLGAVGGGFLLVKDPSGIELRLPLSLLDGSPFANFLIPGIFLLIVNGIGSMIGAGFSFTRSRYAQDIAIALGVIMILWIVIQLIIIKSFHWVQAFYFILGAFELGIGLQIRRRRFKAA